jgi:hypothetical protein
MFSNCERDLIAEKLEKIKKYKKAKKKKYSYPNYLEAKKCESFGTFPSAFPLLSIPQFSTQSCFAHSLLLFCIINNSFQLLTALINHILKNSYFGCF